VQFPADASIQALQLLVGACDDRAGCHIPWLSKDGTVRIALAPAGTPIYVVHDPLAARDDAVYLFEPLARGGGWVGPGAANDLGWMEELFTHLKWAWERYEEAQRGQKFIAPEVEGLALTLAGLLGHFE